MEQATLGSATADAVLQTAIQIEELGRDFYDALGTAIRDRAMADLCRRLASAESGHLGIFRRIRSELARQGKTVHLHDRLLAEARRVGKEAVLPDRHAIRRLVSGGGVADLLDMAIQMERQSIRFYRVLASQLPNAVAVESVIREEEDHLRLLQAFGAL